MKCCQHETAQRLSDIVTCLEPWFRTRLWTITIWPTTDGGWEANLGYAHYTTRQRGETVPSGINVTYPRDTDHPVVLDGEDLAAALQAQVLELENGGEVGRLMVSRVAEPPGTPLGAPPSTGWTILTHSGSEAERRAWQCRIGPETLYRQLGGRSR